MFSQSWNEKFQGAIHLALRTRKTKVVIVLCFLTIFILMVQDRVDLNDFSPLPLQLHTDKIQQWMNGTASFLKPSESKAEPIVPEISSNITEGLTETIQSITQSTTPFLDWMSSQNITVKQTPFISIADSKYLQPLNNLKDRLDKWPDRDYRLIVICLDMACTDASTFSGYGGYLHTDEKVMGSVALIKFQITLELSKNGFNFVFLDGDVYLTGSRDPLEDMLPTTDENWDIQFQYDESHKEHDSHAAVNIGWFMSKSTPATIEFYERSYTLWNQSHMWDQKVMNIVLFEMEKTKILKVNRLWNPRYQNWMATDWQSTLFGNETAIVEFISEASVIHFTCVEQGLKSYFGSNFGGYGDVDGYYSQSPPLLRIANVSGLIQSIQAQVAFASRLATATNRTLIWPDTVGLLQNATDGKIDYKAEFAGVRTLSYASVQEAGVNIVEGRYLINRKIQTGAKPLNDVVLDPLEIIGHERSGPAALEKRILAVKPEDVVVIDFSNFSHSKWLESFNQDMVNSNWKVREDFLIKQSAIAEKSFQDVYEETGMKEYSRPVFEKIKQCANANNRWPRCLSICK